jgi:hypothetical protein
VLLSSSAQRKVRDHRRLPLRITATARDAAGNQGSPAGTSRSGSSERPHRHRGLAPPQRRRPGRDEILGRDAQRVPGRAGDEQ